MSDGPSNLERRQKAIQAVRRRARRLEIEMHRVKAHLARLEADYEEDVADWMSRKLRRRSSPADQRVDPPHQGFSATGDNGNAATAVPDRSSGQVLIRSDEVTKRGEPPQNPPAPLIPRPKSPTTSDKSAPEPIIETGAADHGVGARLGKGRTTHRKTAPPLMASLLLHAAGLLFCISFGFVTAVQQAVPLFASPNPSEESIINELSEVKIEPTKFEDEELQNVIAHTEEFNLADNQLREFEPMQLGAGSQSLGDIGQLDALPSDLDVLMSGGGSPGSGPPGGERGAAVFFGARSQGDRFVFVVDNSSSMNCG